MMPEEEASKSKNKLSSKLNVFSGEKKKEKKRKREPSGVVSSNKSSDSMTSPGRESVTTEESSSYDIMALLEQHWDEVFIKMRSSQAWQEMEDGMNHMVSDIADVREENETLKKRLALVEGRLMRAEKKLEEANEHIIDITSRSMRENLVLKNIPEKSGETEQDI